ncbi:MAG: M14 family zinc carboxypeptidase [Chloroflexota bacterium]|nr:M14 family zinc carboxypeptidase [Chloroflexota bacterium]
MIRVATALFFAFLLIIQPLSALAAPTPQEGQPERYYVDIDYNTPSQAATLARLLPHWDEALEAGSTRLVLTQAEINLVRQQGYEVNILGPAPRSPEGWPACYNRLDSLFAWLQNFAATHPTLVDLVDYGDSWCKTQGGCTTTGGQWIPGDDLWVARITNELATGPKQGRLFVDAGMHAREIPTPELARAFIELLVDGYGTDPDITWMLDQREIYVVLSVNPDGRRLVEMGVGTEPPFTGNPWYWRKTGNNSYPDSSTCSWPPTSSNHYGTDPNRNHVFKWDEPGHSDYVCAQTYRGPGPASEPEIDAYETFVRSIIPDQRGEGDNDPAPPDTTGFLINLHNVVSGGIILVPWGWTTAPGPNNSQLETIAAKMGTYNGYGWSHSLYAVSGNTRDWGYGELGIPSYTIELDGNDFFTSCSLLPGIIDNMLPLLTYAASISDLPYQRVYGPDARNMAVSPGLVTSGETFDLSSEINDSQNGNQPVAAAEYYLVPQGAGVPGAPGSGMPMSPTDGSFNSPVEYAGAVVDTAGLGRGHYLALVRGLDSGGNWGPLSAQRIRVECFFADMDCSGLVDVNDVILTANAVQRAWTQGFFSDIFDINHAGSGDGVLDIVDIQTVAALFGSPAP